MGEKHIEEHAEDRLFNPYTGLTFAEHFEHRTRKLIEEMVTTKYRGALDGKAVRIKRIIWHDEECPTNRTIDILLCDAKTGEGRATLTLTIQYSFETGPYTEPPKCAPHIMEEELPRRASSAGNHY